MRCRRRFFALTLVVLAGAPRVGRAALQVRETDDLRLLYRDVVQSSIAPHVGRCFENAMDYYRHTVGYEPSERVTVLLDDASDFNNASAFATPRNTLLVQIAPAGIVYETLPGNERINHTLNHELAHIVALDRTHGADAFFRSLFCGKAAISGEHPESIAYQYLTSPRFAAPRWFHEGFAVFLETWMAGGIGRAQGAYDEMVFRSMVRDQSKFFDPLGLESEATKVDFQAGALSYLYGTRFITWLGLQYGPESVLQWAAAGHGSAMFYGAQFERVYGTSLTEAWHRWVAWEHQFQSANLESLRLRPLTPYRDLGRHPLGSVSRAFVDHGAGKFYAGVRPAGQFARLAAISLADGSIEELCEVKGPALYSVASLAFDAAAQRLFYTTDNNEWRDLNVYDLRARRSTRLLRDARIGDLAFDATDASLWGIRHFNGISTLVRVAPPYGAWTQVHSWPYGQDPYDLDVSPDGMRMVFSLSEPDGRQTLRLCPLDSLRQGAYSVRTLHDFGASVPANFVFSKDGRFLHGSSYYTGVSNVWRFDAARDTMEIVSNCDTGFFRPVELGGDSLLVFRYGGDGFVPAVMHARPLADVGAIQFLGQQVAEQHPVVQTWNAGSPARVDLQARTTVHGPYRGWCAIRMESVYPIAEGYDRFGAAGLSLVLSDPGFAKSIHASLSYTPSTDLAAGERVHARVRVQSGRWTAAAKHNGADFYDLFGPTKTGYKGSALGLRYERRLVDDRPRRIDLDAGVTGYTGLDRVPTAQNIDVIFHRLLATRATVHGQYLRRSLGAVDDERGRQWSVEAANNTFGSQSITGVAGTFDIGCPLPVQHTSAWLRLAAGYSPGDRSEPFANFFFGAFGNNYVDHQTEKRYREYDSFPGVPLDDAGGTNFTRALGELNLPPLRFEHWGTPSFYATWARPAVFATALRTNWEDDASRRTLVNFGTQVDLRFTVLCRLSMTLSGGYARAFERHRAPRSEWMLSLKVL